MVLGDQPLVPPRLVHGREVVALQVLDQGEGQDGAIVDLAPDRGDPLPAEGLAGAQPPLAGDQLITLVGARGSHHHRLQQPGLADRRLQLFEGHGIDVAARLKGVRANVGDRQFDEAALALGFLASRSQQGLEAPTETTATCNGFRHAGTSGTGSAAGEAGKGGAAMCSTRPISSCATAR